MSTFTLAALVAVDPRKKPPMSRVSRLNARLFGRLLDRRRRATVDAGPRHGVNPLDRPVKQGKRPAVESVRRG